MKPCYVIVLMICLITLPGLSDCPAIPGVRSAPGSHLSVATATAIPENLDPLWKSIWALGASEHCNLWVLMAIGFSVGILGRFFGVGGTCLVTPGLNISGFPIAMAVGTDLTQMTAKAYLRVSKGGLSDHIDLKLLVLLITGMITGVESGVRTVMWLTKMHLAATLIRVVYLLVFAGLGLFMANEYRKLTRRDSGQTFTDSSWLPPLDEGGTVISRKLQAMKFPPIVTLSASGVQVSFWIIIAIAFVTGWLFGLLGGIGAFLPLPAMIYLMGIPVGIALRTDLYATAASGTYGCLTYALKGQVEIMAVFWILLGTFIASLVSARAVSSVRGKGIQLLYAGTAIAIALSIVFSQFNLIVPAQTLFLVAVLVACAIIIIQTLKDYTKSRQI